MSEFELPFWVPFWLHFGGHFGVHFGALEIQLDAFGIPEGHHFEVKWWIHQKTVPGPPLCHKTLIFIVKIEVQKSCGQFGVSRSKSGRGSLKETKKLRNKHYEHSNGAWRHGGGYTPPPGLFLEKIRQWLV